MYMLRVGVGLPTHGMLQYGCCKPDGWVSMLFKCKSPQTLQMQLYVFSTNKKQYLTACITELSDMQ